MCYKEEGVVNLPPYENEKSISFKQNVILNKKLCQDKLAIYSKDRSGPVSFVHWTHVNKVL